MKFYQYMSAAALTLVFCTTAVNAGCATIGCAAKFAIRNLYLDNPHNEYFKSLFDKCKESGEDPKSIGKCIRAWMPTAPKEDQDELTDKIGEQCNVYCNKGTCKKTMGYGGDSNCVAVCCAAKAGNTIKNCCKAAGDKTCCGNK